MQCLVTFRKALQMIMKEVEVSFVMGGQANFPGIKVDDIGLNP